MIDNIELVQLLLKDYDVDLKTYRTLLPDTSKFPSVGIRRLNGKQKTLICDVASVDISLLCKTDLISKAQDIYYQGLFNYLNDTKFKVDGLIGIEKVQGINDGIYDEENRQYYEMSFTMRYKRRN